MKKKIEAELVSLAHRLLKMNNYKDTVQLHDDVKKLYDQLTLLRFYEENFTLVEADMGVAAFEEKAEKVIVGTIDISEDEMEEEIVELASPENIEKIEHELMENVNVTHDAPVFKENVKEVEEIEKVNSMASEPIEVKEEIVEEPQKESAIIGTKVTKQISIDDVLIHDYQDTLFVKKEDIIPVEILEQVKKVEEVKPEEVINKVEEPVFVAEVETPKQEEIKVVVDPVEVKKEETPVEVKKDSPVGKAIVLTLNDKIAFEKNLFAGNTEDLNRVVSQLNTFTSFDEAKSFVVDFVKPDYNNWTGKEEFETRFLEIVENKFK